MPLATSLLYQGSSPGRVAKSLSVALSRLGHSAGALIFVSGELARQTQKLGQQVASLELGVPVAVVPGVGVLTEEREIEGDSAAAILAWRGGHVRVEAISEPAGDELFASLSNYVQPDDSCVLTFLQPDGISPASFQALPEDRSALLLGGGMLPGAQAVAVTPGGRAHCGSALMVSFRGLTPPLVAASPACQMLMPLTRITSCDGAMVLEIGGESALEVLTRVGRGLGGHPLILAAITREAPSDTETPAEVLLRPVQGVDPLRGGLMLSEEIDHGVSIAFAIRDSAAAKEHLQATARQLARSAAGAAPRFAIYVNCAGRGRQLHASQDVDVRVLREHLGPVPIAGLQSSFELAPHQGRPALQMYTGVPILFTAPS